MGQEAASSARACLGDPRRVDLERSPCTKRQAGGGRNAGCWSGVALLRPRANLGAAWRLGTVRETPSISWHMLARPAKLKTPVSRTCQSWATWEQCRQGGRLRRDGWSAVFAADVRVASQQAPSHPALTSRCVTRIQPQSKTCSVAGSPRRVGHERRQIHRRRVSPLQRPSSSPTVVTAAGDSCQCRRCVCGFLRPPLTDAAHSSRRPHS